jgi:hypothetical protein
MHFLLRKRFFSSPSLSLPTQRFIRTYSSMGSQPKEFALGNPWLPCPHLNGEACDIRSSKNGDTQVNTNAVDTTDPDYKTLHAKIHRVDRKPKKLVVLCDGK